MVAQGERQEELFEVFVLGVACFKKLVSQGRLEAIKKLSLIR